jgi:hypothetical protein
MIPGSVITGVQLFQGLYRLTALAEIHRPSRVNTETGFTNTWTPIASGIPIGVAEGAQSITALEALRVYGKMGQAIPYIVLLPVGTDVGVADRIYQTTGAGSPRTFEVVGIPNKDESYETLRRVVATVLD